MFRNDGAVQSGLVRQATDHPSGSTQIERMFAVDIHGKFIARFGLPTKPQTLKDNGTLAPAIIAPRLDPGPSPFSNPFR